MFSRLAAAAWGRSWEAAATAGLWLLTACLECRGAGCGPAPRREAAAGWASSGTETWRDEGFTAANGFIAWAGGFPFSAARAFSKGGEVLKGEEGKLLSQKWDLLLI